MERPRDEVVAAARERTHAIHGVGVRVADDDDRDVREPAESRLVAEQHEIRPRARRQLERLGAVVGAEDVETVVARGGGRGSLAPPPRALR